MKQERVGFWALLALVFIGLKLAGIGVVATWSWWWVLAPLWIPLTLAALVVGLVLLFYHPEKWVRKHK